MEKENPSTLSQHPCRSHADRGRWGLGNRHSPSIPHPLRQEPPARIQQRNPQRHLASRMGAAAKAGIEAADARLHPVEQGLGDLGTFSKRRSADVVAGDLGHGAVHRQVALPRGNDQIHPGDQTVAIHPVVVKQRALRRLQLRVAGQLPDRLQAGHDLQQPGVVISKRRNGDAAAAGAGAITGAEGVQLRISPTRYIPCG
jgi:hypothetical protein